MKKTAAIAIITAAASSGATLAVGAIGSAPAESSPVVISKISYSHAIHHQLPRWVHWQHASKQAALEVCGHGPAIIAWGGNGDTSVIICKNGKADIS